MIAKRHGPILLSAAALSMVLCGIVFSQGATSPSDTPPAGIQSVPAEIERDEPKIAPAQSVLVVDKRTDSRATSRQTLVTSLTIFTLAVFVGFEVITKVPPTLHTPLMSGSNAISGITLVGAVIVASYGFRFSSFIGFLAVILAMINVAGGFLVTHRMLSMFKRR